MGAIEHCIETSAGNHMTMGDRGSNNMGVDVRGLRGGGNGVSIVSIIMLHCHSIWIQ